MDGIRQQINRNLFRTSRFLRRFRRNTMATLSQGNSVELLHDGKLFFTSLLTSLTSAQSHIFAEFYIIHDDQTGKLFADALIAAAQRGLQVRLTYDYLGCIDTPEKYFRRMQQNGVHCIPFNKPSLKKGLHWFDRRNHRKFVLIDGITAFLGGMNIGDEYSGCDTNMTHWRDFGVKLAGPVANDLEHLFLETWNQEIRHPAPLPVPRPAKKPAPGNAAIMVVSGSPQHNRSRIAGSFRMALAAASVSARIITPYFVPGPRMVRALLRAAQRGVAVQLILPALSDVPLVQRASRAYLAPLLKGNVRVYERDGAILHAKVMLIDCCWATVGSANLDLRSFHRNYEVNVVIDHAEFGKQLTEMFSDDLQQSREITLIQLESRSWLERLLERICDPLRRFL